MGFYYALECRGMYILKFYWEVLHMCNKFVTLRRSVVTLCACACLLVPTDTVFASNVIKLDNECKISNEIENTVSQELNDVYYKTPEVKPMIQVQPAMLQISGPDINYLSGPVMIDPSERDLLERLVQGESGGISVEAAALVAQCIRDAMVYKGYRSIEQIRTGLKYSGSIDIPPNSNTKEAVHRIFDLGESAVQHRLFYFYAPRVVDSRWHETQEFIIEFGGHRFFDEVPVH